MRMARARGCCYAWARGAFFFFRKVGSASSGLRGRRTAALLACRGGLGATSLAKKGSATLAAGVVNAVTAAPRGEGGAS